MSRAVSYSLCYMMPRGAITVEKRFSLHPAMPRLRLRVRRRLRVSFWTMVAGLWHSAFGLWPSAFRLSPAAVGISSSIIGHWSWGLERWPLVCGSRPLILFAFAFWALASSFVFGFFCRFGFGVGFVFVFGSCFDFAFGYDLRPSVSVRWPLG